MLAILQAAIKSNTPEAYREAQCKIRALLQGGSLEERHKSIAQKIVSTTSDLSCCFQKALLEHENDEKYVRFTNKIEEGIARKDPLIGLLTIKYECDPSLLAARIIEEVMFGDEDAAFVFAMYSLSDGESLSVRVVSSASEL
jgi:hypothetical protein